MDYSEMIFLLEKTFCAEPVKESDILNAELEIGTSFSPSHRFFLSKFGASLGNIVELAGIFNYPDKSSPPQWMDVIRYTKELRKDLKGDIPGNSIFVSHDGSEDTFYIDPDLKNSDGESPVFVWGPGVEGKKVAASFAEFVVDIANDKLDY